MIRKFLMAMLALTLATVTFALLAIWLDDGRWGATAGVSGGVLALVSLATAIIADGWN